MPVFGWKGARGDRRGRRRGFKKPTQWVMSTQAYNTAFNLINAGVSAGNVQKSLLDNSTAASALGDPLLDRYTLMRLVGYATFELSAAFNADSRLDVDMGFIVVDVPSSGVDVYSPILVNDGDAEWINQRHWGFSCLNGLLRIDPDPTTQLPNGVFFDIRQKRILRPNQRLVMQIQLTAIAGGGAGTLAIRPFFRSLIAKAI